MNSLTTHNPTEPIVEDGCFLNLPKLLGRFQPHKILLCLGQKSFKRTSHYQNLLGWLESYEVMESSSIFSNPTQEFIEENLRLLKGHNFDLVLAIGGGSVLDVAKVFALILNNNETTLESFIENPDKIQKNALPLICVPTTAGTGSEVTPYVSIESSDKKKISLSHPLLFPKIALIDPVLTYTMPDYVTACTGFDALSQAIESYWSRRAIPETQKHALEAIELILESFKEAYETPKSEGARHKMAVGSYKAGLAIAHTRTTAVHSVSYPITTHFGVAHGHACALTLSSFVLFNSEVMGSSANALLKRFKTTQFQEMAQTINNLMDTVRLPRSLKACGIHQEGIDLIIRDGFRPDRVKNNPRDLGADELREILQKIFNL